MKQPEVNDIIALKYFGVDCYAMILTVDSRRNYSLRLHSDDPQIGMRIIYRQSLEVREMYTAHVCGVEAISIRRELSR
jgi:hypothetical protein